MMMMMTMWSDDDDDGGGSGGGGWMDGWITMVVSPSLLARIISPFRAKTRNYFEQTVRGAK